MAGSQGLGLWYGLIEAFQIHFGVTRHPTQEWVAQQLKEATPFNHKPKYLIRDRDSRFGHHFDDLARASGIEVLKTAYRTPKMNSRCERFLGSVRLECLDHLFIFGERQLGRVLKEYLRYFNQYRPHQGLKQTIPDLNQPLKSSSKDALACVSFDETRLIKIEKAKPGSDNLIALPVLGGLHHHYYQAAA